MPCLLVDFVHQKQEPYDDCGHGTHVAGCLAGDGYLSDGRLSGIAPASHLIVGKILDQNGSGNIDTMISAIQWILDHQKEYNIKILNIYILYIYIFIYIYIC